MKLNTTAFHDPFLRHIDDISCPLGLNPHEAARMQPGPGVARTFEQIRDTEQKEYPKSTDYVLAKGLAVGLNDNGMCCHFWPGRTKFLGFLVGSNENRASVKTRGSIVLKLEGVTDEDISKPVYAEGPNSFSLNKSSHAAEIGKIRFVQGNGLAHIAFKRYDSDRPLSVRVD